MVTRITDAGALPTPPPRTERTAEGTGSAAARPGQDAEASAAPAVRLQLSPATQLKASAASTSATTSDEALVQQIRQRLESGQFHIDYDKVGEGMLRDLIAQSLHRTRQ